MYRLWVRVRILLRHTRIVPSGSPPLYRMVLASLILAGVVQLVFGVSDSISDKTPGWFDRVYSGTLIFFAVTALISLYLTEGNARHARKLHRSLRWEWFGLVGLVTNTAMSFAGVVLYNHGLPTASATWVYSAFGLWALRTRLPELAKALRELGHDATEAEQ